MYVYTLTHTHTHIGARLPAFIVNSGFPGMPRVSQRSGQAAAGQRSCADTSIRPGFPRVASGA